MTITEIDNSIILLVEVETYLVFDGEAIVQIKNALAKYIL